MNQHEQPRSVIWLLVAGLLLLAALALTPHRPNPERDPAREAQVSAAAERYLANRRWDRPFPENIRLPSARPPAAEFTPEWATALAEEAFNLFNFPPELLSTSWDLHEEGYLKARAAAIAAALALAEGGR